MTRSSCSSCGAEGLTARAVAERVGMNRQPVESTQVAVVWAVDRLSIKWVGAERLRPAVEL